MGLGRQNPRQVVLKPRRQQDGERKFPRVGFADRLEPNRLAVGPEPNQAARSAGRKLKKGSIESKRNVPNGVLDQFLERKEPAGFFERKQTSVRISFGETRKPRSNSVEVRAIRKEKVSAIAQ